MKKIVILSILALAFTAGDAHKGRGRAKATQSRKYSEKPPKHRRSAHSFIFFKESEGKARPGTTQTSSPFVSAPSKTC
jgi:hypothetical protein